MKHISMIAIAALLPLLTLAADLEINSFHHNGLITWTNTAEHSNQTYRVEWTSDPASDDWHTSWAGLTNIAHSADGMSAAVPMFYRVVMNPTNPLPGGMVKIPEGSFQMGDTFNEGDSDELPVHTVYLSEFSIDSCQTTKALWEEVYNWAIVNGYSFDNQGSGKADNHPVYSANWYDVVKWCNARSEKEGRVPAYYTSSARTPDVVYRTGGINLENSWVNWESGYRLPTEAEWEKAARGGANGRRFPWSDTDTIQHARANYYSSHSFAYDTSLTTGFHPDYNDGVLPYTSPVGSFAPNGYGLYDMAGNVSEWVWDRYNSSYYSSSLTTDPHGPDSGSGGVNRGARWAATANCRVAARAPVTRSIAGYRSFRCVLPASQ